mmetsp:Transcript_110207/g.307080  ORF Transcript_110207/g.307080 Transcript_110207/m.307080 type:complete len:200 (+) Transcript_110207:507-1106(+)
MTSSSPSPWPVRLSPKCFRPWPLWLPKKMQSTSSWRPSSRTADTSRSTWPLEVSQPRAALMFLMLELFGRSTTEPFSMAKAALIRLGAFGITERTKFPMVGSRMSMKCCPSCAGKSSRRKPQPFPTRTKAPTRSTSSLLDSKSKLPTFLSLLSSRRWNLPFLASCRWPPLCTARTKAMRPTSPPSVSRFAHTTSSKPHF